MNISNEFHYSTNGNNNTITKKRPNSEMHIRKAEEKRQRRSERNLKLGVK